MSRIIIEKVFSLESRYLNENLRENLLNKIRQDTIGKCDEKYGYITKIYNKINIVENTISTSCPMAFFRVKFGADTIKPEVNSEYEGKVCMIFSSGIFVEVFEKIRVLIPCDKLKNYKFDKLNNTFVKDDKIITMGDKLNIVITMVQFQKQNFNCIGSLKN
jgi:DNA-directed RNA polymerase subunit E'/Rpb7